MSTERIITLHPEGKSGANLSKELYEQLKEAIIMPFLMHPEIKETELEQFVGEYIKENLEEKKGWYIEVVKQDLLAREALEYVPDADKKALRLKIIFC